VSFHFVPSATLTDLRRVVASTIQQDVHDLESDDFPLLIRFAV